MHHRPTGRKLPVDHMTLDLRLLFRTGEIDYRDPDSEIEHLRKRGFTRLVYPQHSRRTPWETSAVVRRWIRAARQHGVRILLYTGPFGSEPRDFLSRYPESAHWLQRRSDGQPATYDREGWLLMFCPTSDYLTKYRLPLIEEGLENGFHGVFFDIPWIMKSACHCERCRISCKKGSIAWHAERETRVRKALAGC